ncbi:acetyltransferase [Janthinobacterium agaricidamnosum]|uniref:Bacterial transferase hexapeptide family protein n=1 Tax=Janthinobacterium agaricidamnosum NBRC 102515 = DSM 9628 TaxID=1349767 RepID=W0V5P3_9BURK|nr:acetyltransferase [Janthinobacterium agaricidamnosum]CDG82577.1 bacterial transferase hexapeptide family protein [Janthinobacterium agaricidamnosum NBRC 102515 = DSM 9628]
MKNIIIVGAGRFARELICWLEHLIDQDRNGAPLRIKGLLDDTLAAAPALDADYPYPLLGSIADYRPGPDEQLLLAIGAPQHKLRIARELQARGAHFYTLVHPSAIVARTARIGQGAVICPFALLSANITLADFVTINSYSSIGHDAVVGAGSTLSSHVDITGAARIGEQVFIGSGASVLPRVAVGDGATVGAGAVVMRRVAPGTTVYALPAKKL